VSRAEFDAYEASIAYFWPHPYTGLWEHSDGNVVDQDGYTRDLYGWDEKMFYDDTLASPAGQNNVEGAASRDATYSWFEFRKALDSGDGYDWSWAPGETQGDEGSLMLAISSESTWFKRNILLHLGSGN
jgi:hypothetical protein